MITKTQVKSNTNGDERDIIIGLDFGTACTKVVIRDDVINKAYAVPFGELAYDGHPYLIATQVYACPDDRLSLDDGDGFRRIDDLKIKLLGLGDADQFLLTNNELGPNCVGYLALVLREVLAWFLETHKDIYGNTRLNWQLNIGIPSRSYDNEQQCKTFHVLALAAWQAAVREGQVTIKSIQKATKSSYRDIYEPKNHTNAEMHSEDVKAVPEVIAEVVGYADSELRREGTHLLVDVGAGTLDVATFVLHSGNDADQYGLLTTEVEKLGAYSLHRQRIVDITSYVKEKLNKIMAVTDGISPLPELESYKPIDDDGLSQIDTDFLDQCRDLIHKVIQVTKTRRAPNSLAWNGDISLPVLLCGGGHRIPLYQKAIELARKNAAPNTNFDFLELPKPENLEADELAPTGFYRLAVAYGLSTRQDRIGKVIPPNAIEDIPRQQADKNWRDEYISAEMT